MNDYKINQENVLGDTSPDRLELIADVYLVEFTGRFSVISRAPRSRRLVLGSDISEILSFNVSHELRKYLLSYGDQPIVIPTFSGSALVLPQLFAASRLFLMVFFKHERSDALARVAASKAFEGRVGLLAFGEVGKPTKWDEPLAKRLDYVLNITDNILDKSVIKPIGGTDYIVEKCNMLFDGILELTGVRAELSVEDGINIDESFDASLFNSFCLSVLMLCQRYAKSERADVRLFKRDFGLSVSISFESSRKISRVLNPDIAHFNAISDLNNMIFESSFEDGRYEVTFTPARKDWSLLELKFPEEFTI